MAVNFHQPSVNALWDMMPVPLLTFGVNGTVTFANTAAKLHPGKPVESMGGKLVIRSLVGDMTLGKVKLPYAAQIELAGGLKVNGQFMSGPSSLDVAFIIHQEAAAPTASPRMPLEEIIALLRDEVMPPIRQLRGALAALPTGQVVVEVEQASEKLQERLRRISDLIAVFGDEVLQMDDRVEIALLVKDVCSELKTKAAQKKVLLTMEEPKQTLPPLYGNVAMLRRAFFECIDNAISNSRSEVKSSQFLEVKLSCQLTGEHVLVSVRNQGALPEEVTGVETRDLFAFKPGSPAAGSGTSGRLGLPLVHRIVGLHGGNMRVSAVGGDEVRVLMEFPTGAPVRGHAQLDSEQVQRYAHDLAQLMSRRKKEVA
jgi:signal transduction histidine kinase